MASANGKAACVNLPKQLMSLVHEESGLSVQESINQHYKAIEERKRCELQCYFRASLLSLQLSTTQKKTIMDTQEGENNGVVGKCWLSTLRPQD
eukprot:192657-Rhodomonas_salina.7